MRLAVYNVENLFDRAKIMNLGKWADGRQVLTQFAALNGLLGNPVYSESDKEKMVELLVALGLKKSDDGGKYVLLRRNHGGLLKRAKNGNIAIVASGRSDWLGSLELKDEPVDAVAIRNTAQVLKEVNADVQGVIEAESRPALAAFNDEVLKAVGGKPFRHVMLIDGNDRRGIDVGLMGRDGYPIGTMRSHVDDCQANGEAIFSRDCPEYEIATPKGNRLIVAIDHLKSKGYGGQAASNAKRKSQAVRTAEIYQRLVEDGEKYVAVVGDFNDTPDSAPLQPLLADTALTDVFKHKRFDDGGHPGTHGSCGASGKIDYILLSPALYAKVQGGGVFRKGMWAGVRPKKWETLPALTRPEEAASDHAAVWVDIDI